MQARWLLLPVVVCMAACSGDAVPIGPTEAVAPEVVAESTGTVFASNGKSACYTVSGEIDLEGPPGNRFTGFLSGDVEGEAISEPGPVVIQGKVIFRPSGTYTWIVTGGSVDALIGRTVIFDFDLVIPFGQLPLMRANIKARVVEGAQRGNVTIHGWTDVSSIPFTLHQEYHGVICP